MQKIVERIMDWMHAQGGELEDTAKGAPWSNVYYYNFKCLLSRSGSCSLSSGQTAQLVHISTASVRLVKLHWSYLLAICPRTWKQFSATLVLVSFPALSGSWIISPQLRTRNISSQQPSWIPLKHITTTISIFQTWGQWLLQSVQLCCLASHPFRKNELQ